MSFFARLGWLWGILLGAAVGLAVGLSVYLILTPVLEASTGLLRELQGLVWNLVPMLTVLGGAGVGVIGWRLSRRRGHPSGDRTTTKAR